MTDTEDKPGIEEAYLTASTTSNLKVEAERRGAGDILIAVGWSPSRLGAGLARLHTDWDKAEKPARADRAQVERMAAELRVQDAKDVLAAKAAGVPYGRPASATSRAQATAQEWYAAEVSSLVGRLNALPAVYSQITLKMLRWNIQDAEHKAAGLIRWWLNQTCPVCDGTKLQVVEGTHRHNGKVCKHCSGTGLREIPHGQEGRRVANFMDSCVEDWAGQISNNLSSKRQARNKTLDTNSEKSIIAAGDGTGR